MYRYSQRTRVSMDTDRICAAQVQRKAQPENPISTVAEWRSPGASSFDHNHYDVRDPYKQPNQIVEMLVDIISKNGCMLLNVLQRPDHRSDRRHDGGKNQLDHP